MASIGAGSMGPQALDAVWLDELPSQAPLGCGLSDLFTWDTASGAGTDFTTEVESVSRLFPHLDGLPPELTGGGAAGVAEQSAVCGATRVGSWSTPDSPPGPLSSGPVASGPVASPGDQCLMSPSDALLGAASPDGVLGASPPASGLAAEGDWKVATGGLSCAGCIATESSVTDEITTLIEFVEPARGVATRPPPAEEIFVSPENLEVNPARSMSTQSVTIPEGSTVDVKEMSSASPVDVTSPAAFETAAASGSSVVEMAASPEKIDFLRTSVEEEDEHTRMIDQALEDLKTLESMCGITSDNAAAASASSASLAASLTSQATAVHASAPFIPASPTAKATASSAPKAATSSDVIKQETVTQQPVKQEEDDIEIVEERPAPRRRRRRPPRVAVTPGPAASATSASTQIVIVLTDEQLAAIQKSGQIVLNAAALQPSLAAAESLASQTQKEVRAQNKTSGSKAQTVVRPSASAKAQSKAKSSSTIVKPSTTITGTITSVAGASSAPSTSTRPSTSTSAGRSAARQTVKRPQVIVKQEAAKRAKRTVKRPAGTKDPLSGWMEQKLPPSSANWDLPLLPVQHLDQDLPPAVDAAANPDGIPDDLQDVLLDGTDAGAVPTLPADTADGLLEELFAGTVAENPAFFEEDGALQEPVKPAMGEVVMEEMTSQQQPMQEGMVGGVGSGQAMLLVPPPGGFGLSPQPQQQVHLDPWTPTLSPSAIHQPVSPASECHSPELAPAPDWPPAPAARRGARRPRPYDKGPGGAAARRQPLTEEERRERKKEQNKNAATRYRQKKKVEHDLVSGDQELLETRNKALRERVGALSRELNYLKQLMREVLRHKQVTA